jgi:hypothetical protein
MPHAMALSESSPAPSPDGHSRAIHRLARGALDGQRDSPFARFCALAEGQLLRLALDMEGSRVAAAARRLGVSQDWLAAGIARHRLEA